MSTEQAPWETEEDELAPWETPDPSMEQFKSDLFPSRLPMDAEPEQAGVDGVAQDFNKAVATGSDLFNAPTRFAAQARGQEMSDPDAYAFRPETEKYKTAIDENIPESAPFTKGVLKFGTELLGRTISDPISYIPVVGGIAGAAKNAAKMGASKLNSLGGKLAQELSGVSEEALRLASTKAGRAQLRNASGRQSEIGAKLTDAIDDFHNNLPEKAVIENALKNMPPVDMTATLKVLQDAKIKPASNGAMLKHEREANAELDQLIQDLKGGTVSADEAYDIRKRLDFETDFNQPYAKQVNAAKFKARTQLKNDLLASAGKSGNPEYAKAMKDFSDKLKVKDKLISRLGKTSNAREGRSEAFIANLFGKNSANKQETLKDLDYLFGTDLLKQSKMTFLANELGEGGKASIIPRQSTGRSLLATAVGAPVGATVGAVAGPAAGVAAGGAASIGAMGLSSPAVASRVILPTTQFMENVLKNGLATSPKGKALVNAYNRTKDAAIQARIVDQLRREIEKNED